MLTIDNTVDGGYGNELPRISIHQDFKCVCVSVCVSVCNGSGKFGGRDYSNDSRPSYLLYFVLRVRGNK